MMVKGGPPPGRRSAAMRRPAAQLPPSSMRASGKVGFVDAEPVADQRRHAVEQGDGHRAPGDDQRVGDLVLARRVGGIGEGEHARVHEQAAVAIFGEAGEAVDVDDLDARLLERLDQRIGQPLRELVQRHEAVARIVAADRRVPPAIAERDAVDRPAGPPRSGRAPRAAVRGSPGRGGGRLGAGGEHVVEAAGAAAREQVRPRQHLRAEPAEQGGAALEAEQGIVLRDLEAARQRLRLSSAGEIVERAGFEHALAGDGQAFGAGVGAAARPGRDSASRARCRRRAAPRG